MSGVRRIHALSQREAEVLTLVATGTPVEKMASDLFLSPHTVRTHVKNIRRKLDARTCAHAVALACAHDLILPSSGAQAGAAKVTPK
ncbi:MAG: response regulator transcription factor [Thermoleophilaceae bacterium]